VRAETDVVEACTYYAHRAKLQSIGEEDVLEQLNVKVLELAVEAARETGALVAGNICNTWEYDPSDMQASEARIRGIFSEQVQWAKAGGADFIIAETFNFDIGQPDHIIHGPIIKLATVIARIHKRTQPHLEDETGLSHMLLDVCCFPSPNGDCKTAAAPNFFFKQNLTPDLAPFFALVPVTHRTLFSRFFESGRD
jgi:hypothetical protein